MILCKYCDCECSSGKLSDHSPLCVTFHARALDAEKQLGVKNRSLDLALAERDTAKALLAQAEATIAEARALLLQVTDACEDEDRSLLDLISDLDADVESEFERRVEAEKERDDARATMLARGIAFTQSSAQLAEQRSIVDAAVTWRTCATLSFFDAAARWDAMCALLDAEIRRRGSS